VVYCFGQNMMKKIKKIAIICSFIIVSVSVITFAINKCTYRKVVLSKSVDAVFSSQYTNQLVVVVDGKMIIYDENANKSNLDTPFNVSVACPLENSVWVVDVDGNLYEVTYDSYISDVILTNVKYINMSTDHYTAITNAGELYVWGDNLGYRLGVDCEEYISIPTKIDNIANAKETSISYGNTVLLLDNGNVFAAGMVYQKDYMERVDSLKKFTFINELENANKLYNSGLCVLQKEGEFKSWSHLYKNFEHDELKAKQIISVDNFLSSKKVIWCSVGAGFTTYLTENGDIFYWGNDFLETTDCKCEPYAIPCQKIPYIDGVDMIYAGRNVVYAQKGNYVYIIK